MKQKITHLGTFHGFPDGKAQGVPSLFYLLTFTHKGLRIFNHLDLLFNQPTFKAFKTLKIWLETPYQTLYIMVMSVKSVCLRQISKKTQAYVVAM